MTTQLLFGEIFTILQISENQKWLEIHIFHDNYVGWIDTLQCTFVSEKYFKKYAKNIKNHQILTYSIGLIKKTSSKKISKTEFIKDNFVTIIKGGVIPFVKIDKDNGIKTFKISKQNYIVKCVFYKNLEKENKKTLRKEITENAFDYLHTPYLWGGRTIFGIDCSGLIQQVFRSVGYYLPRDAYQQAEKGKLVNFDAKKQGDLAFFVRENKIIHVGIVLEDNKIIHARGQVRIDTLTETGILDENTNEYSHYLAFLKRIL